MGGGNSPNRFVACYPNQPSISTLYPFPCICPHCQCALRYLSVLPRVRRPASIQREPLAQLREAPRSRPSVPYEPQSRLPGHDEKVHLSQQDVTNPSDEPRHYPAASTMLGGFDEFQ